MSMYFTNDKETMPALDIQHHKMCFETTDPFDAQGLCLHVIISI